MDILQYILQNIHTHTTEKKEILLFNKSRILNTKKNFYVYSVYLLFLLTFMNL